MPCGFCTDMIFQWFFSVQPIYVLSAYSVKTTLILLYLRVWREDASNRKFRLVCKGIGCFVVLAAIAAIMATTFGCVPIAAGELLERRGGAQLIDMTPSMAIHQPSKRGMHKSCRIGLLFRLNERYPGYHHHHTTDSESARSQNYDETKDRVCHRLRFVSNAPTD